VAQFFYSFDNQTEGVAPDYWKRIGFFSSARERWAINDDGTYTSARIHAIGQGTDGGNALQLTGADVTEFACRVKGRGRIAFFASGAAGSNSATNIDGYTVDIGRYESSGPNGAGAYFSAFGSLVLEFGGTANPDWRNIRIKIDRTATPHTIDVYRWLDGNGEPATPTATFTTSTDLITNVSGLNMNVVNCGGSGNFISYDWIGFGTDGDPAPTSPLSAAPVLSSSAASSVGASSIDPTVGVTF